MDRTRRHLTMSLALLPLAPTLGRAVPDGPSAIPLRTSSGAVPPAPPLRYDDASPGPILHVKKDASVRIALQNGLSRPTSLDLQGVRVSAPLGGAGPLGGAVAVGTSAEIAFAPPDSGTFWFHPWILDPHENATAQGLAGVLIVEDPTPPEVDADLVAILTDRWPLVGDRDAEALHIDGYPWPRTESQRPGSRIRLRLVNASTERGIAATCSGTTPHVVAIDGQPSDLFKPLGDSVPVGPGARFDLMFDMPATSGAAVKLLVGSGAGAGPALVIEATGEPRRPRAPIRPLPANPLLPAEIPLERSTRATLVVRRHDAGRPGEPAAWTVNGVSGRDLSRLPLFRARRGTPVMLALRNASPELVSVRVHGFAMRLLHDLDDGWEPYWRDSVLVPPDATHHAAFLADLPGRWLIESPFFAQAAGGLRGWFEVT